MHDIDWQEAYQRSLSYSNEIWQQMLVAKGLPAVDFKQWQPNAVATCARALVFKAGNICLYHYQPLVQKSLATPVLIVYAFINRPSILDITAERSFIRRLLAGGADVYLLDWGNPTLEQATVSLADYIKDFLHRSVMTIRRRQQAKQITLLGVCQGGVFSLCYASLYPQYIQQLITMVTPVDFHTPGDTLCSLLYQAELPKIEHNIPGAWLTASFLSLRPAYLQWQKYQNFFKQLNDPQQVDFFIRMEQWIYDNPDHPAAVFKTLAHDFYQHNKLIKQEIKLGKKTVNLHKLSMPLLNLYATEDHIVPPASSSALENYVSSPDYTSIAFQGGHIGIFVSQRAQQQIPATITRWLAERA